MDHDTGVVAALDCGTNSTRLLIAAADGKVLHREMRITRLGAGVDASQTLSAEAMARTVSVLGEYRTLMDESGVEKARLVATSAVRDAANAEEFLSAARSATGVEPELLSGLDEGRLSFRGATSSLTAAERGSGFVLVVDIGGGSTELVAGVPPTGTVTAVSLDIGCVRLTERFFHHDPPLESELAEARAVVDTEVGRARDQGLPAMEDEGLLVGLAGTVSTLAALELELAHYERNRIHHAVLSRADVDRWLETLSTEERGARLARPGMVEGRADVIVGGVLVLAEVMAGFDRRRCLVSEDDILDGMVAGLL